MKFSIMNIFIKSSVNVTKSDLVTFAEEILHGKLHFLCSASEMHLQESYLPSPFARNCNTKVNKKVAQL